MVFRETDAETLKHLCICPNCRKVLYQHRETVRREYFYNRAEREKLLCEAVSATDIFDYAVPYGLDPAKDQYAKFRQSLISHMRACPTCLAKMQQLHNTIYDIAERTESEVITIYHIDKTAKMTDESDDLYTGFPIKVEVASREDKVEAEQPAPAVNFAAALKRKVSVKKLKSLLKPGIAAAAVILIGVMLLVNPPTAKAVTIGQIYKAIERIKNVYIAMFVPDRTEAIQELWASRTFSVYMTKTKNQTVLWNVHNRTQKIKDLDAGTTNTIQLTEEKLTGIEEKMSGYFGLTPFKNISAVPLDAKWNRIVDDLEVSAGIEVYDLTWERKTNDGSLVFYKWRFFVDPRTYLPKKIECYLKSTADGEYVLQTTNVVEYLDNSQIQVVLEQASF